MSQEQYHISGKAFILGEYAVLMGLPALVAAIPPRFTMRVSEDLSKGERSVFHPGSPIAKLQKWAKGKGFADLAFEFGDPLHGKGGMGASTAQFAMAYFAYAQRNSELRRKWSDVWELYRELTHGDGLSPSGADLVAQWQGGVVFFDPSDRHCLDVWPLFDGSGLLVFSATHQQGRKVATHEHLNQLRNQDSIKRQLEPVLIQGIQAVRENHLKMLGRAMDDYAQVLHELGLECDATLEDRKVLRLLPGVLGVKGSGALQSDLILVLMEPQSSHHEEVIRAAAQRGLNLVTEGLICQLGITCQKE